MTVGMFGQMWTLVDGLPYPWNRLLEAIIAIGVAIFLWFKTVKIIPKGEEGIKLRLGEIVRYRKGDRAGEYRRQLPGRMHFMIPFVDNIVPVGNLIRQIELPGNKGVEVADYRLLNPEGMASFLAVNAEGIRFKVEDLEPQMRGECQDKLREAMVSEWQGENDLAYSHRVKAKFAELIRPGAEEVGLELKELYLPSLAQDPQMAIARAIASLGPEGLEVLKSVGVELHEFGAEPPKP